MKISVDGGALCASSERQFGNYIFSFNLLKALKLFDKNNQYFIYTFYQKQKDWPSASNFYYQKLVPRFFWMKLRVSWQEIMHRKDIFLALNQAVPFYTPTRIISFCHGLSYYYFPHLYRDSYARLISHFKAAILKSDHIIVSSFKVKNELQELFPKLKNIIIIPYGIPFDMLPYNTSLMRPHSSRKKENFFLFVGMNHPIKNVDFLVKVFLKFIKEKKYSQYKLYLAGNFEDFEKKYDNVYCYKSINRLELRSLYQKATAYLTVSFYESFNLPVLEALSQNCPVVGLPSAIIPEFKSYVNVVKNREEFIDKMKKVTERKIKLIPIEKIKKIFSWKNYIEKLAKLYQL